MDAPSVGPMHFRKAVQFLDLPETFSIRATTADTFHDRVVTLHHDGRVEVVSPLSRARTLQTDAEEVQQLLQELLHNPAFRWNIGRTCHTCDTSYDLLIRAGNRHQLVSFYAGCEDKGTHRLHEIASRILAFFHDDDARLYPAREHIPRPPGP